MRLKKTDFFYFFFFFFFFFFFLFSFFCGWDVTGTALQKTSDIAFYSPTTGIERLFGEPY